MKKVNLIFAMFVFMAVCVGFSSCDDDNYDAPDVKARARYKESGLYLGITGFNDYLNPYVYDERYFRLLTSSSAPDFKNFVDNFSTDISTVLYYAVDDAITNLEKAKFPEDLSKVLLITFTDGLDEGSFAYGSKYSDVTFVNEHLKSARVDGKQIEAYAIGLKGNDVKNEVKFKSDLKSLASSSRNVMEMSNINEIDIKFQELAVSIFDNFFVSVPVKPSGVKTRFTFDEGLESASQSSCYIEGTWSKNGSLVDVTYRGLKCASGEKVLSNPVSDSKTLRAFTFEDVSRTDGSHVDITKTQVWNKSADSFLWTLNSEFDPDKSTRKVLGGTTESVVIMLVLDCSSSLGNEELSEINQAVKNFIDRLWMSTSPDYCRVTFNSNGGNEGDVSQILKKGVSVALNKNIFTRDGYGFSSWNTKADGSGTSYTNQQAITLSSNIKLYAQWVEAFEVTFEPNGGTGKMNQQAILKGKSANLIANTFTRDGYIFAGWNTRANGSGTSYTNQQAISLSSSITLYAQWKGEIEVTFEPNGGTGKMSQQAIVKGKSANLKANTFTRSGYVFTGWNTKADGSGTSYTNQQAISLSSSITLYAQWKEGMVISLGSNSVYIGAGKIVYLSFTPTQAKTYTFYSTGSKDTYATLYNASWSKLDSDDDGGTDNNFSITKAITSSQVGYPVFLAVKFYSSSASGTVSVYVQ